MLSKTQTLGKPSRALDEPSGYEQFVPQVTPSVKMEKKLAEFKLNITFILNIL